MITIILRGDPVPKGRHRSRIATKFIPGKGKIPFIMNYPEPETAAYEEALKMQAFVIMRGKPMLAGPLEMLVTVTKAIPNSWTKRDRDAALAGTIRPDGKPDWDNYGKITDALNGIVWKDDGQVVDGRVIKLYGEEPKLRIDVKPIDVLGGLL